MTTFSVEEVAAPDWSEVRFPDERDPLESRLVEATRRGRAWALADLGSLLPDFPLDELAQSSDGATLRVGRASPEVIDRLQPERLLERLLVAVDMGPGNLKLVRDQVFVPSTEVLLGDLRPTGRTSINPGAVARLLDDGFTLVIDGSDLRDEASMRLAESVERIFGCMVNTNTYISRRPTMSFGAHWDDQEVIILQLLGCKDWTVEAPAALSMNKTWHGSGTTSQTVWSGTVAPGTALYVPRGWGHRVRAIDELSFHHTVTIPRHNGVAAFESMLERARATGGGGSRMGVPIVAEASFGAEVGLGELVSDDAVRWSLAHHRSRMASRSTQSFSALSAAWRGADLDELWVRSPISSDWVVAGADRPASVLAVDGRQVRLSRDTLALLAEHADGAIRPLPRDPALRRALADLTRFGLLQIGRGNRPAGIPAA